MRSLITRVVIAAALGFAAPLVHAGPKIGVILKAKQVPFWQAMEKGAVEAGQKLGVDVTVSSPMEETDVAVQIRLLNAMAGRGVNAIVIAPINKESLAVPIASVAVSGVKIVTVDTPLTGNAAPVFIGTDQEAAGKAAGEFLAKQIGDTDEVSIFRHSQASGATQLRETGAIAALRALRPNATLYGEIYASSEPGAERSKAELVLQQHPKIKAVLAIGTPGTLAMLQLLQDRHLAGQIKLVGFGFNLNPTAAAAIASGALTAWVAQLPKEMGAKGVEAAVKLLNGEAVPAIVHTDFIVITKENLSEPKVQALLAL